MLKKSLEVLAVTLPLVLLPSQAYAEQPPYISQSKPPVYAQASEDLTTRLLKEADEVSKKNPISAIPLYRRVIAESDSSKGQEKEQAIEKLGNLYYKLVFDRPQNKWIVESALNFYDEVIKKHPDSKYLSKAYHISGLIHTTEVEPKDIKEGIRRMKEAYHLADLSGDLNIKIDASWNIGRIGFEYVTFDEKEISLDDVKFYLRKVIEFAPGSRLAEAAKTLLKKIK